MTVDGADLGGVPVDVRVSIVIPVYNEGEHVVGVLDRILAATDLPVEVLCVYDTADDSTVPAVAAYQDRDHRVRGVLNELGRGPANAIRAGFLAARSGTVVVTMADGSDDPACIDSLVALVERGCVVACASRYMPGGAQVGADGLKAVLSRGAGRILSTFARVGTRDATNSFKAYDREWVEAVGVESANGFEMGLELVAKARRNRRFVAEVPTVWLERSVGISKFKLAEWLPFYWAWFQFAFGGPLSVEEIRAGAGARAASIHRNKESHTP